MALTETEMLERNLMKAARSATRLKHSLAADRELNTLIPKLKKDLTKAIKEGRPKEFAVDTITELYRAV